MGTINQKLNDYIWKDLSLFESTFVEAISKILLRFREKEDRKGFNDFLDGVTIVDTNLLDKLKALIKKEKKDKTRKYESYYAEGNCYRSEQKYDQALKSYQEVINLNPQDDRAYTGMGMVYVETGKYEIAVEKFEKAFKINPKNSKIFNRLNMIMNMLDRLFFTNKNNSNYFPKINTIKIKNFKQYKNFSISFSNKINIIIGQNAIGKTTLLQAITLGLLKEDSSDTKQVEYDTFISNGEEKSELIVYHNDEEKKVEILKDKREIEQNYFIPFILAYGSNFFTSKTNEVKEVAQGIVNKTIHKGFTNSIFVDYTSGFVNPIRLLEFLDLEKDEKVPKIQKTFIDTINSFLEGFKLVENDKNYYFQKNGADTKLRLEDLSEGYRGNVLLIADMLIKILGVGYTPKTIEGIILIDEFDKHLHPKWQSKLVNQLTKTFPKIQFIMTTHNPMSILDRNSDEITKLVETKDGIKAIQGKGTKNIGHC